MQGSNIGIPIPFSRLVPYLPNIQKGTYYLIGAGTKVGKSSLTDLLFLYNVYEYYLANPIVPIRIDYYSFEVEKVHKIVKGICLKLQLEYGYLVDTNHILSYGKNRLPEEIWHRVLSLRKYFEKLEDILHIHDIPSAPSNLLLNLKPIAEKTAQSGGYHFVIVDHVALLQTDTGMTGPKQAIDKLSQGFVTLRNLYGTIPVVIQQLSFDSGNSDRAKAGRLSPTLFDFGDSKYTTRDANVVMALFNPHHFGLKTFHGYNIERLQNHYRSLSILANRDGEADISIGLYFEGRTGLFRELPRPEMLQSEDDYLSLETKSLII